ncbi:MAG: ubiquinone biosynthesis protein UbiH, partial [Polynucleobacter victoriensis]
MKTYDLIIVGAGIAGKATSLRLAQLGLKILHIAPSFDAGFVGNDTQVWDSRIYALSASTKQLLEKIHVWDALDSGRIQGVSDMRIYGDSGAVGDELHFSAYSATVPQLAWIVE